MYQNIEIHEIHNKRGKYFFEVEMFSWLDKKSYLKIENDAYRSDILCNGCAYSLLREINEGKFVYTGKDFFSSIADDYERLTDNIKPYVSKQIFERTENSVVLNFKMEKNIFLVINQYPGCMGVDFSIKYV